MFADMIRRRSLRTRSIKMLILDESDEMLNKGFKEQIYDVYRYLPPAIQVHSFNSCLGIMVIAFDLRQNVWSSKLSESTIGFCQEENPEYEVLHCSSKC